MEELKILTKNQLYEIAMKEKRKAFGDTMVSHKGKGELIRDILVYRACREVMETIPKCVFPRGRYAKPPGCDKVSLEDCVVSVPHLKTKHSIITEDGGQEKHLHSRSQSLLRTQPSCNSGEGKGGKTMGRVLQE